MRDEILPQVIEESKEEELDFVAKSHRKMICEAEHPHTLKKYRVN